MKKNKLGILKSACSNLQRLKLYERKYKCALVKSAALRLRVKLAKTNDEKKSLFMQQSPEDKARILRRIDWGGMWKTPIGRWLRKFFETNSHKEDLVRFLMQPKYIGHPKAIRKYLSEEYGMTDENEQQSIIDSVNAAYAEITGDNISDSKQLNNINKSIRADADKEYLEGLREYDKKFKADYGYLPTLSGQHRPVDTRPLHRRYRDSNDYHSDLYDRAGIPYSTSDYLTDSPMYHDRSFMQDLNRARGISSEDGATHNHYYFIPQVDSNLGTIKPVLESSLPTIDGARLHLTGLSPSTQLILSGNNTESSSEPESTESKSDKVNTTTDGDTLHSTSNNLYTLAEDSKEFFPHISHAAYNVAPYVAAIEDMGESASKVWNNPLVQRVTQYITDHPKDKARYYIR